MDNQKYLKDMYADQLSSDLKSMKHAYNKQVSTIQREASKIPGVYADARNQVAANNAIEKRNFDERAAANGLNTGAGGMAQLSMSNAYQNALAGLLAKQREEEAQVRQTQSDLRSDYMAAVEQAKAQNAARKNQALYQEMVRAQAEETRQRERAEDKAERAALRSLRSPGKPKDKPEEKKETTNSGHKATGTVAGMSSTELRDRAPEGEYGKGITDFTNVYRTMEGMLRSGNKQGALNLWEKVLNDASREQYADVVGQGSLFDRYGL